MTSQSFDLLDTPDVTDVEIIALSGVSAVYAALVIREPGNAKRARVGGECARQLIENWRKLPPGEMARCHVPAFGLRFWNGEHEVGLAHICWGCSSIYGSMEGKAIAVGFDDRSQESLEFFQALQRIVGIDKEA